MRFSDRLKVEAQSRDALIESVTTRFLLIDRVGGMGLNGARYFAYISCFSPRERAQV